MKNKKTGIVLIGLAAVALGSVGFSAWIISGTIGNPTSNVKVSVGDVKDQGLYLTLNEDPSDLALNFDAKKGAGGNVVSADSSGNDEDMSFIFSVSVQAASQQVFTEAIRGKTLFVNFTCEALSKFSTSYIMSPVKAYGTAEAIGIKNMAEATTDAQPIYYTSTGDQTITKVSYTITADNSNERFGYKYDVTYSFAWGSTFGYKNPVYVTSLANGVEDGLKAINDLSNSIDLGVAVTLGNAA